MFKKTNGQSWKKKINNDKYSDMEGVVKQHMEKLQICQPNIASISFQD
jgi:hypothetical protein